MFVGFIAVIVILLLIVGYMSQGTTNADDKAAYYTEAHKVKVLLSNIKGEALFYYQGNNESYKDITATYFKDVGFSKSLFKNTATDGEGSMVADEWKGLSADYNGEYITVPGPVNNNMRIVIKEVSDDNGYTIEIVGLNKDSDSAHIDGVDEFYPSVLEAVMNGDMSYMGG